MRVRRTGRRTHSARHRLGGLVFGSVLQTLSCQLSHLFILVPAMLSSRSSQFPSQLPKVGERGRRGTSTGRLKLCGLLLRSRRTTTCTEPEARRSCPSFVSLVMEEFVWLAALDDASIHLLSLDVEDALRTLTALISSYLCVYSAVLVITLFVRLVTGFAILRTSRTRKASASSCTLVSRYLSRSSSSPARSPCLAESNNPARHCELSTYSLVAATELPTREAKLGTSAPTWRVGSHAGQVGFTAARVQEGRDLVSHKRLRTCLPHALSAHPGCVARRMTATESTWRKPCRNVQRVRHERAHSGAYPHRVSLSASRPGRSSPMPRSTFVAEWMPQIEISEEFDKGVQELQALKSSPCPRMEKTRPRPSGRKGHGAGVSDRPSGQLRIARHGMRAQGE